MKEVAEEQKWQGKLITARIEDRDLNTEQCFWWLSEWRTCPTHTIAGMFEIYEQLLPTRLYAIHKTKASPASDPTCRLCGTAPESMAHVLSACPALAQTKYLARHDAVPEVLFFDIIEDLELMKRRHRGILIIFEILALSSNNSSYSRILICSRL